MYDPIRDIHVSRPVAPGPMVDDYLPAITLEQAKRKWNVPWSDVAESLYDQRSLTRANLDYLANTLEEHRRAWVTLHASTRSPIYRDLNSGQQTPEIKTIFFTFMINSNLNTIASRPMIRPANINKVTISPGLIQDIRVWPNTNL